MSRLEQVLPKVVVRDLAVVGVYAALFGILLVAKPGSYNDFTAAEDLGLCVLGCVAVSLALSLGFGRASDVSRDEESRLPRPNPNWAPVVLSFAIVSYTLAWCLHTIDHDALHAAIQSPSWEDAALLLSYPLMFAGVALLPGRKVAAATKARMALDGLMVLAAVFTFSWCLILGPMVLRPAASPAAGAMMIAYPVGALLLAAAMLLLWSRLRDASWRPTLIILGAALSIIVLANSIAQYRALHHAYRPGELWDVLQPLGYMLLGLAVRSASAALRLDGIAPAQSQASAPANDPSPPHSLWQSLLSYALVPIVSPLLVYVIRTDDDKTILAGACIGAGSLVALVVLRQTFALREIYAMYSNNEALARANLQLEWMASTDALTGLPNRALLNDRLEQSLRMARRDGSPVALLLMDLDRFKEVNDTLGHRYGDLLLKEIGPRVQAVLRESDTVGRLGGDEFAVVLPATDGAGATYVAKALIAAVETPVLIEGQLLDIGVSVGIAVSPEHSADAATLMRQADIAMYVAKRGQRGHAVYKPEQDHHSPERLALMPALRQALEEDRLLPCYQPMVDGQTGQLVGVEVLLHWQHAEHGFIPPDHFIPIAEHTGLIAPLTDWVLQHALHQAHRWQRVGLQLDVAVNLSMRLLQDTALVDSITAMLRHYGIRPGQLTLEVTESALMADPVRTHEVLTRLAHVGIHIAIDDFGTGQSSLGYLKQLPVDTLKIDKSFVLGMATNAKDTALVRSIIAMAHALGLAVVAEGVENAETWELLRSLECDLAQGYYLGRPLPAQDLEEWIIASRVSRIA